MSNRFQSLALVVLGVPVLAFGLAATTAHADTIYVCWDGSGDCETIQARIDGPSYADGLVVREGTHIAKGRQETRYLITNDPATRTYVPPRGGCDPSGLIS
ncbi:unnamed protein product, partial [marine sediment metagenome]